MKNISSASYLIPRLIRHFLPEAVVRFLLLRGWVIRPGMETRNPKEAVERYQQGLLEYGDSLKGKRVLVLGYGGRFAIGCALLEAGASHVVLCEYKVTPDRAFNQSLLMEYPQYLSHHNNQVEINPDWMTLVEVDIRIVAEENVIDPVDVVLSNSVFEHLEDVPGIACALSRLGVPGSTGLHFVDLRDHFFKYPFEMLRYSEKTWYRWLNPKTHHNRLRIWDYRAAFTPFYSEVNIEVRGSDESAFQAIEGYILPEFKRGNLQENSVTHLQIFTRNPVAGKNDE